MFFMYLFISIYHLFLYTQDVVRKHAYSVLAEKVDIKAMTIANRMDLLKEGLNDRSGVSRT